MSETLTIAATVVGISATMFGLYTGWKGLQHSQRRLQVRLEAMTETVVIVVTNPGHKEVPLSGVRLLTDQHAALPLDALTEGHFPLALAGGTAYKLPMRRKALIQVLERNGVGAGARLRAEALDATGKGRKSPFIALG